MPVFAQCAHISSSFAVYRQLKNETLSVFGVERKVMPTSNRNQIQDISAEVARNGKVKISEFYPQKVFRWG